MFLSNGRPSSSARQPTSSLPARTEDIRQQALRGLLTVKPADLFLASEDRGHPAHASKDIQRAADLLLVGEGHLNGEGRPPRR